MLFRSIQTDASFRITIGYRFQDRLNQGGEHSQLNTATAEFRYTPVNKGMFSAKFSLIQIGYNAVGNSPVAYEMLEALQPGKNYTWNVGMQRNISKSLQISLNYDGRKPEGIKTIHTGSMQARAFF